MVVLAFENLYDNETLMKENIIPPNYGDFIKPKIVLEALGVRIFNEVLKIQGSMAGTGRTGPGMKLTSSKTFLLARSTKVHHCRTNGL